MNESIFGEPDAPSGWKFPYEENKLGDVKFSNWRARRIIEEFHHLVDLSIPETDADLRNEWKQSLLRLMLWKTGEGEHYFQHVKHNANNDDSSSDDESDYDSE